MRSKPILIVAGEPKSVFFEIFFKSIKHKNYNSPLIIICSKKLINTYMVKNKIKKKIHYLDYNFLKNKKLNNKLINIINIDYTNKDQNSYIKKSFDVAFKVIRMGVTNKLINGPISKKKFLKGKFPGITEYVSNAFNSKKNAMLIFNKRLAVCPVTTHIPIKNVSKNIKKQDIKDKVILINNFYLNNFHFKPKIAIVGLNPHCESFDNFNEDEMIIKPTIINLQKKFEVSGPYPADTVFLKDNRKKFNVIVGMYHDQVLAPLKTLFEYNAINITLGLPFIRITPDHGPNEKMVGKNLSNPKSLINAISFLDNN